MSRCAGAELKHGRKTGQPVAILVFLAALLAAGWSLAALHQAGAWLTLLSVLVIFAASLLVLRQTLVLYARRTQETITAMETARAEVQQAHEEKEETLHQLINTVATMIDLRDNSVAVHSQRVARVAVGLGKQLGLSAHELSLLHAAGLLHDVGKFAVAEAVLNKPARLTAQEYELVKHHAAVGERILAQVGPLREVARMVGEHHERYDGTGYPMGKSGWQISMGARILAVADALDTILSDRPYARRKNLGWALAEIDRCAGTHFDPAVVAALHVLVATAGRQFFSAGRGLEAGPAPRLARGPGPAAGDPRWPRGLAEGIQSGR